MPQSESCLRPIHDTLPHARFLHIHRDPRHVANSLMRKRWAASLEDGARVWGQYVDEITGFINGLPARQTLTLSYRRLVEDGSAAVETIGCFLGLADTSPISDFLASQHRAPTPFSDPVRDIGDLYIVPDTPSTDDPLLELAGRAAVDLGTPRRDEPGRRRFLASAAYGKPRQALSAPASTPTGSAARTDR